MGMPLLSYLAINAITCLIQWMALALPLCHFSGKQCMNWVSADYSTIHNPVIFLKMTHTVMVLPIWYCRVKYIFLIIAIKYEIPTLRVWPYVWNWIPKWIQSLNEFQKRNSWPELKSFVTHTVSCEISCCRTIVGDRTWPVIGHSFLRFTSVLGLGQLIIWT